MTFAPRHPWLSKMLAWFEKHPEREFYLTRVPLDAITPVGFAGWIVGVASQPIRPNGVVGADVAVDPLGGGGLSRLIRQLSALAKKSRAPPLCADRLEIKNAPRRGRPGGRGPRPASGAVSGVRRPQRSCVSRPDMTPHQPVCTSIER